MIPVARTVCLLALMVGPALAQQRKAAALEHFERVVRPILAKHCYECHGPKKSESGLRFDSRASVFGEQDFGKTVIPGDTANSRLLQVLRYADDDVQMPPDGKLPDETIGLLEKWVRSGAAWPAEPDVAESDPDAWKNHWAFQTITRPQPPAVNGSDWPRTNIDRFVLARLEASGLQPAAAADVRTRVRRLWFDLIGLPPEWDDVQSLSNNPTAENYSALVDRLLDSPHFGERWARHWMDVSRYSDTTGYVFREERKLGDAWKYREWLISAFNSDMPIDEFLIHQIAVDRVLSADAGNKLAATGYLTLGRRFLNNVHDIIDDRIDVVSRGMMGLTVTCARCHDHKYDPIPSADYYSLYGVFASSHEPDRKKSTVRLVDLPNAFQPYVFRRGQAHNRGPKVPRQFLGAIDPDRKPFSSGSGRLELARAIASSDNPLTARVFVNRVWGHLFGMHLVSTPSDFGLRCDPPSHPELLDYLAGSLIDNHWSLKKLLREIVHSRVYQQQSDAPPNTADPENRLLSRMNRRRLDFESHRDALLAVSGDLDRTIGGPSVDITRTPYPKRRTVYAYIDRQNLPGVFRAFDLATPDTHAPMRYQTTVPQQGLYQLNNPFVLERAASLAGRTAEVTDSTKRVRDLFRLTYARDPSAAETEASLGWLRQEQSQALTQQPGAWQYGYGRYDADADRVVSFTSYPVLADRSRRGGAKLPDQQTGWSHLTATGGHPGDVHHAAIRRFVVPRSGTLSFSGVLKHAADRGDGVIGRLVSDRQGQIAEWSVTHRAMPTFLPKLTVEAGEIIDVVCDSGPTVAFDSFEWKITFRLKSDGQGESRFDSVEAFERDTQKPLGLWARYAQVLLLSNEFVFVD